MEGGGRGQGAGSRKSRWRERTGSAIYLRAGKQEQSKHRKLKTAFGD